MNGTALLALQTIDSELDLLAGRRQRLPERTAHAHAEAELAAVLVERSRLELVISEAIADIERSEHEGADLDRHQARLEAQLKTVIAPREAEALMHEIETLRRRHGALDDAELEAMQRQADAEQALAELLQVEAERRSRVSAAAEQLDATLSLLAGEERAVAERRRAAEEALSAADLEVYAAARRRHAGVGIAQVDGRACTGCHLDMSQAELEELRRAPVGELPECPNCGRLVVV